MARDPVSWAPKDMSTCFDGFNERVWTRRRIFGRDETCVVTLSRFQNDKKVTFSGFQKVGQRSQKHRFCKKNRWRSRTSETGSRKSMCPPCVGGSFTAQTALTRRTAHARWTIVQEMLVPPPDAHAPCPWRRRTNATVRARPVARGPIARTRRGNGTNDKTQPLLRKKEHQQATFGPPGGEFGEFGENLL